MIVSRHSRRTSPLRHVTKTPSPQLVYFPHLQNRDTFNSFVIRSYENCRVSPSKFQFWNSTRLLPTRGLSPLAATLMDRPASVANKRLTLRLVMAKPCRCNTYKKQGVPPASQMLSLFPASRGSDVQTCRRSDVETFGCSDVFKGRRRGLGRSGRRHRDWSRGRLGRWAGWGRWVGLGRAG